MKKAMEFSFYNSFSDFGLEVKSYLFLFYLSSPEIIDEISEVLEDKTEEFDVNMTIGKLKDIIDKNYKWLRN